MNDASPLRYPGGKWRLAAFFERLIYLNGMIGTRYVEPYAGGGSLALSLLIGNHVSEIHLNDLDLSIYSFWHSVINRNREFVGLIRSVSVTPDEWSRQKSVYAQGSRAGKLAFGFATFFLNRTNHSGILNGGMIGGKNQKGEWKLDARFNKRELIRRIQRIATFKSRIHLHNDDAVKFLRTHRFGRRTLIYLDPPYFHAGRDLYLNAYQPDDHGIVRDCVSDLRARWVVSYDDVPAIKRLYKGEKSRRVLLLHTARNCRFGHEIVFFSPSIRVPRRSLSLVQPKEVVLAA